MNKYNLQIELLSPALIGSGERMGALIDSDIIFDDIGLPYIPGRRIKGLLRESAIKACEMLEKSNLNNFINITKLNQVPNPEKNSYKIVAFLFGMPGQIEPAPIYFSNLFIENYEKIKEWLEYLMNKYNAIFTKESIINYFTEIRQQTALEDGVAKEGSLRTLRLAKKGLKFNGDIFIEKDDGSSLKILWLACENLRFLGTKRNRGFGEVKCTLFQDSNKISFLNELESLCSQ